jgi:glycosyltransferase involved in cell wall biosynthesis
MSGTELSVIVPAYNEADRLPEFLDQLVQRAPAVGAPAVELLVVDDGSAPEHAQAMRLAVERAAADLGARPGGHRLSLLTLPRNGGKGGAIRAGWAACASEASWLGFLDADGAVSAREFWRLARMLREVEADVLAGSRIPLAGRDVARAPSRRMLGRTFRSVVEQFFRVGFYDTQCGVKFFSAGLLRPLLPELREDRWLLDVELLAALKNRGARFHEEPINWVDPGGSKVRFWPDSVQVLLGLWRLRQRMAGAARDQALRAA